MHWVLKLGWIFHCSHTQCFKSFAHLFAILFIAFYHLACSYLTHPTLLPKSNDEYKKMFFAHCLSNFPFVFENFILYVTYFDFGTLTE